MNRLPELSPACHAVCLEQVAKCVAPRQVFDSTSLDVETLSAIAFLIGTNSLPTVQQALLVQNGW